MYNSLQIFESNILSVLSKSTGLFFIAGNVVGMIHSLLFKPTVYGLMEYYGIRAGCLGLCFGIYKLL